MFQNANLSVRVTDDFLQRRRDRRASGPPTGVTTGRPMDPRTRPASCWTSMAEGDLALRRPGRAVRGHDPALAHLPEHGADQLVESVLASTCSSTTRPATWQSINLMKFRREDGTFDVERFRAACRIFITPQEILVDHASYPTDRIAANSHKFRPLGLGYANLGSLIMAAGLPYDSRRGPRRWPGRSRRSCTAQAYLTSAEHRGGRRAVRRLRAEPRADAPRDGDAPRRRRGDRPRLPGRTCRTRPATSGTSASTLGREHGYRNSQVTVLAPTGTIAFMMDCDTTGIEPDIALVKYKQLAGGGMLKIVNRTVPMALRKLGYDEPTIRGDPRLHRRARHDRGRARA